MLALAALMILMAVGALIKVAVEHGLLTPEVRIGAGALAAILVGAAGLYFRQRDELRYGNVLLALSLAIVDLVAWGAGPRLHLVPTIVALGIVDVVAIALAVLALSDGSEFLFSVAAAGALSAPFVTSDGGGTALALAAVRRDGPGRCASHRAGSAVVADFAVLVAGALMYSLAAGQLPISASWYGPYLITMFGGACALAALLFAERAWRSELPRAYLAVTVIGVILGWDAVSGRPMPVTMAVALGVALVTYASLLVRNAVSRLWTVSALLLPFVSLGVASAGMVGREANAAVFALWAAFALVAWQIECRAADECRGATHLLMGSILGAMAVGEWLWPVPLAFVAGLAGWSVAVAWLGRNERHPHAVLGVGLTVLVTALSAIDQLASRGAYSYTPFATRSSASALCAAVGIALVGEVIGKGSGGASALCDSSCEAGGVDRVPDPVGPDGSWRRRSTLTSPRSFSCHITRRAVWRRSSLAGELEIRAAARGRVDALASLCRTQGDGAGDGYRVCAIAGGRVRGGSGVLVRGRIFVSRAAWGSGALSEYRLRGRSQRLWSGHALPKWRRTSAAVGDGSSERPSLSADNWARPLGAASGTLLASDAPISRPTG